MIKFDMVAKIKSVIKNRLFENAKLAYGQEGEDMMLARIFWEQNEGFYLDVGAHHPTKFSNTQYFYSLGWRGINIDALPGSMKIFNKERKHDINLEIPVSDKQEKLTYHIFNYTALNSFDAKLSAQRDGQGDWRLLDKIELNTRTLVSILDEFLPKGQHIDFMSVDVEGYDMNVLRSNDWSRYRPAVLLIEDLDNLPIKRLHESKTCIYMESLGYELTAKSFYSLFFNDVNV